MSRVCSQCGAQMPDISSFCAACGSSLDEQSTVAAAGRKDALTAALSYVTFVPAVVFLLVEPYCRNRFVRFHSFQSIFFSLALVVAGFLVRLGFDVLPLLPAGYFIAVLLSMLLFLACVMLWLVLLVKALQQEVFQLPFLGALAFREATRS